MKIKNTLLHLKSSVAILAFTTLSAHALIFYGSQSPEYNTTPPTGEYTNSGWNLQGQWLSVLGTPVSPHYFAASKHVGGAVGDVFTFRNVPYKTVAQIDHPEADLILWKIDGTFPAYASLYRGTNFVGQTAVVFGRGAIAGAGVYTTAPKTGEYGLRGWYVGKIDARMRWGLSKSITANDYPNEISLPFDQFSGPNQCIAELGDSSGGLFAKQDGEWRLLGLVNLTDGLYSLTYNGSGFSAGLFDQRGIYSPDLIGGTNADGTWQNDGNPIPSHSYALSLPDFYNWLIANADLVALDGGHVTNTNFTLNITANPTSAVSVQASTNLVNWQTLGAATYISSNLFQYTDTNAIPKGEKFYRAIRQ